MLDAVDLAVLVLHLQQLLDLDHLGSLPDNDNLHGLNGFILFSQTVG